MMSFNCKTPPNKSKREFLLLKKKEMVPAEIAENAENFNFILPALSSRLRIKDQDLVAEKMQGNNRFYSINKKRTLDFRILENMYDYNLASLKEYLENKERGTSHD